MLLIFRAWKIVPRETVTVLVNCLVTVSNAAHVSQPVGTLLPPHQKQDIFCPANIQFFLIILFCAICLRHVHTSYLKLSLRQQIHVCDGICLSFVVILAKRPMFFRKDIQVLGFKIIHQASVFVPCMTQGPYGDVHYEKEHCLRVDSCLRFQENGWLISTHRY